MNSLYKTLDFDRLGGNFVVVVDVEPAAAATKPSNSVTALEFSAKGDRAGMSLRIIDWVDGTAAEF
jgi:hypothetical protein